VPVAVVGGGDSACEESSFLTRLASKVYLIHRRDTLRASKIMAGRAICNPKIEPLWNSTIREYLTDDKNEMRAVSLENLATGQTREIEVKCVFVAIGHSPNTAPFRGHLDMDTGGYLIQQHGTLTNVPGVFAAGDVADRKYRQAITAAGQGCAAALDAEHYLVNHGYLE
jgi:thioredoxin reductase (NADPH)